MPKRKRNVVLETMEARKKRDEMMGEYSGRKKKDRPSQNKLNKLMKSLFIRKK